MVDLLQSATNSGTVKIIGRSIFYDGAEALSNGSLQHQRMAQTVTIIGRESKIVLYGAFILIETGFITV